MVAIIYRPGTLKIAAVCDGPDEFGRCPRVPSGESVPCAGYDLTLSKDEWGEPPSTMPRSQTRVPRQLAVCPMEMRDVYRAIYQAGEGYFHPFAPQGD